MSFYKVNRNAGRTNRLLIYTGGHDVLAVFSLIVRRGEVEVTLIDASNATTGKDTGLSDERLVSLIKEEIRSRSIMAFNYQDEN